MISSNFFPVLMPRTAAVDGSLVFSLWPNRNSAGDLPVVEWSVERYCSRKVLISLLGSLSSTV